MLQHGELYINPLTDLSFKECRDYEVSSSAYRDIKNGYDSARETGYNKGKAEGLAEGIRQEKLDTARKMKQLGMDVTTIASITGLTEEEIDNL